MGLDAIATRGLARRASARDLLRRLLRGSGIALCWGAGASLAIASVARALGAPAPMLLVIAGPPAALVLVVAGAAWARRWSDERAAIELDHALGLRGRLSSALALTREPRGDPGFIELTIRDAERVASASSPRAIGPVRLGWTWAAWPAMLGLAITSWLLMPRWTRPGERGADDRPIVSASAADEIRQAAELIRASEPQLDPNEQALEDLEALEAELREEGEDPGRALARAATIADESSKRAAERAEKQSQASDLARRTLSDAARGDAPGADERGEDDKADELRAALRNADIPSAVEAAAALRERASGMSSQDREKLAEELRALASSIRENEPVNALDEAMDEAMDTASPSSQTLSGSGDAPGEQEPVEPEFRPSSELANELAKQGLKPEDVERLSRQATEGEVRDELNRRGVEPTAASELAERLAEERRAAEAQNDAREDVASVAEALEQAAEELEQPPESTAKQEPQAGQEQSSSPSGAPEKTGAPSPEARPNGDSKQGQNADRAASEPANSKPESKPAPESKKENTRPAEQASPSEKSTPSDQSTPNEKTEPAESAPAENATPKENPASPSPSGVPSGEPTPATPPPGAGPAAKPQTSPTTPTPSVDRPGETRTDETRQEHPKDGDATRPAGGEQQTPDGHSKSDETRAQPRARDTGQPGEQGASKDRQAGTPDDTGATGDSGNSTPEPSDGLGRLERRLERIADRQRRAAESAHDARRLEEHARKLWEGASPAERLQHEAWAKTLDRERPVEIDPDFLQRPQEAFDARPSANPSAPERLAGELPGSADEPRQQPAWRTDPLAQARQAAESAERAVEQQAVPRDRGDLVRRVFRRFADRSATPAPTEPASPR